MPKIELNKNEYSYLCESTFLDEKHKDLLFSGQLNDNNYLIRVTENQADEIRDLCGEQLQLVGFNEEYILTEEGKILESLIDKFFLG